MASNIYNLISISILLGLGLSQDCVDLSGVPFPECGTEIGYGYVDGECQTMFCSAVDGNGVDWSDWIYSTLEECEYICLDDYPALGDIDSDTLVNVLDIIQLLGFILQTQIPTDFEFLVADYNEDSTLDVLDIIGIVNMILADIGIDKIEEESGYSYQCYPNEIGQFPVVLYNHGGLGQSIGGDLLSTCQSLAENGYLSRSEKREETFSLEGHIEEVLYALHNLKYHEKADSNKIGVVGFSRGGLLSLQASILDDDIDALVLLAPATGNGLIYELFDSFDSISSSVLIQISENDNSPDNLVEVSYQLHNELLENNVSAEMILYPSYDSNYNGIIDDNDDGHQLFFSVQDPYWTDLINFLYEIFDD